MTAPVSSPLNMSFFLGFAHFANARHIATRVGALVIAIASTGCASNKPANTKLMATPATGSDYSFSAWIKSQPERLNEKLVVLSFSGGGVRAATLAAGVLDELHGQKLEDRIALISSTSGGSVTAAVFAAQGVQGVRRWKRNSSAKTIWVS